MTPSQLGPLTVIVGLLGCTEPAGDARPLTAAVFTAAARIEAGGRFAAVTIRNPTPFPGVVTVRNPCSVVVALYSTNTLAGPPAWQEADYLHGCKSFQLTHTIPAGDSVTLRSTTVPAQRILGDSLPSGTYWGTAVVVILEPARAPVVLPLGSLDLQR